MPARDSILAVACSPMGLDKAGVRLLTFLSPDSTLELLLPLFVRLRFILHFNIDEPPFQLRKFFGGIGGIAATKFLGIKILPLNQFIPCGGRWIERKVWQWCFRERSRDFFASSERSKFKCPYEFLGIFNAADKIGFKNGLPPLDHVHSFMKEGVLTLHLLDFRVAEENQSRCSKSDEHNRFHGEVTR